MILRLVWTGILLVLMYVVIVTSISAAVERFIAAYRTAYVKYQKDYLTFAFRILYIGMLAASICLALIWRMWL